jgi:hypothetical protein
MWSSSGYWGEVGQTYAEVISDADAALWALVCDIAGLLEVSTTRKLSHGKTEYCRTSTIKRLNDSV